MTSTTPTRPRRPLRVALAEGDPEILASVGRVAAAVREHLAELADLEPGHEALEGEDPAEIRQLLERAWGAPAAQRNESGRTASEQALRHLELLGKAPAETWFRSIRPGKGANHRRRGADLHGFNKAELRADATDNAALYFVVGNASTATGKKGGVQNSDVQSLPALFVEWDDLPVQEQLTAWQRLGLPEPTLMLTTGGGSAHVYWRLQQPAPRGEWDALTDRLIAHCKSDANCKGAARVMRLAGSRYIDKKTGEPTGTRAEIVHEAPEAIYTLQQIATCLPEPPAPAAAAPAPAPAAPGLGAPVPVNELLPRELLRTWEQGVGEGQRNSTAFTLAASLLALHDAAAAAGLPTAGTPEDALLAFASRCQPPLPDQEVRSVFSSACSAPRATDPGWPERLRFQLNRQAREQRHQPPVAAAPAGAQLAAPPAGGGDAGPAGAAPSPAGVVRRKTRVGSDEVLTLLPYHLGALRLNVRSGEVHSSARGVISANEISRLYLELSRPFEIWPKDATADGITLLASRNPFDPVAEYLEGITADPLPMEQWQQLDHHLLGITDPIAASYLPRFLISAVARVFEPGCYVRQVPVLIGSQERGKGELGRILFGAEHWVEGVGALDRDALMKAHTSWGVELAELDGVTRRADQEHLKAFITETADTYRKPYDRAPERHARKFVFWGTANRPPLRDPSGSTRFVCIPIPDRPLPLEWARQHRDALWARALHQYRTGITWLRTSEAERLAVEARNADFTELDPWAEPVGEYLANALRHGWRLPVKVADVLAHLEVEKARQTNALAKRVREIAEGQGWRHGRRRPAKGADPVQGLWPPEQAVHPVHPVHPEGGAGVHGSDPSADLASTAAVHPVHPRFHNS